MYYLTHNWENKWFHTVLKGICPKVKAGLEFELAYFDVAVQHVSHYAKVTPPTLFEKKLTIIADIRVIHVRLVGWLDFMAYQPL